MSRWLKQGLLLVALLIWLSPAQALAYSYGDANTEDVAETFKVIVSSVGGGNADWATALEAHKVRRSEIQSHFGEAVALTLDKNFEAKDGKLLIANYKAVLVMNLDRRFTYAEKDLSDYAGAKLLLAKAKATFDTLAPYMSSGTDEIESAFEAALDALGNPGLFGVGQKDADPDTFKAKVNFIYGKVSPQFPYKAYVKPAASTPVKDTAATPKPSTSTSATAKPSTSTSTSTNTSTNTNTSSQPKAAETGKGTAAAGTTASAKPKEEAAAATSDTTQADTPETTEASTEAAAGETGTDAAAGQEATAVAEEKPAAEATAPADAASDNTAAADSEAAAETGAADNAAAGSEQAASAEEGHAPMERTDRTNTSVTVFVIAGVILAGGGVLYVVRKRGLL